MQITDKVKIDLKILSVIIFGVVWFISLQFTVKNNEEKISNLQQSVYSNKETTDGNLKEIGEKLDNISKQLHSLESFLKGKGVINGYK